jgi:hypothetical protein
MVKLSCAQLVKLYAMETYGGSRYITPAFLTSALDGGEWSASRPCRFPLWERVPGIHWIEGWVSPRAGPDAVEKRKILHCRESNPGRLVRSPLLYRLSYPDSFYKQCRLKREWYFSLITAKFYQNIFTTTWNSRTLWLKTFNKKPKVGIVKCSIPKILPPQSASCSSFALAPGLTVFENSVLRRLLGPWTEKIIDWRNLYHEELHNL